MKANNFKDIDAIVFFKKHGFIKSKSIVEMSSNALVDCGDGSCIHVNRVKRLVESHELIEKVGGLDVCKKIMFQKRLRQPKATHVLQHHENKKLIQFFSTNQSKPNGSVKLDAIEQAIADVESCMEVSSESN